MGELEKLITASFFIHNSVGSGPKPVEESLQLIAVGLYYLALSYTHREELRSEIQPCGAIEYSHQIIAKSFRLCSGIRQVLFVVIQKYSIFSEVFCSVPQKDELKQT